MEYKRFANTLIVRIDKDEEILEQLKIVGEEENIKLASISALGAIKEFDVGVYDPIEKKYYPNHFEGLFEIVSLTGTINTMNNEYYAHIHMSAADLQGAVWGGHLNKAIVSATCEMVIQVIDGRVDRKADPVTGLNLFSFE